MSVLLLMAGLSLLVLVVADLLWTTLWVDGSAGPVSRRLSTVLWRAMLHAFRGHARILSLAGPIILTATLLAWVGLLWAGWTLLFAGEPGALIDTRDPEAVTWSGRIFFVANAIFTMGNGDFRPRDGGWQLVTSAATASGMLAVTLAVSYVLSVLSAVNVKRAFARGVTGLGTASHDFVRHGWDGKDLTALDPVLASLQSQLGQLVEQHRAYPILHYYHCQEGGDSAAWAVAILDEALTMMQYAVPPEARPNQALLQNTASSVERYLATLRSVHIEPADASPPRPRLEDLTGLGIAGLDRGRFERALSARDERRRALAGMLQADGWSGPPSDPGRARGSAAS